MGTTRRVLVIDAFTNGHEAALAFIERQGWSDADCEVIFCGNHANVLKRLTEGASFAVVPVRNSIIKEITEVTEHIKALSLLGYDFKVLGELELPVNHCLLVPQHIEKVEELEGVCSKEQAFGQCSKYLDQIGIKPEQYVKRDSTGDAAKFVSRLGSNSKIGAIAPKAAAKEYGLRVLAEGIQDVPDNRTTFVLLENRMEIRPVSVGIIGVNGRFGQLLKKFFLELGCTVFGSDKERPTGLSNVDVVSQSEVVIFSIPIKDTPAVIRSLIPFIRKDQLLLDVTSVKGPAVEAMLESSAQVVGLHPMFRPEGSFEGQTTVACPARLHDAGWKKWIVNVLSATGSKIKWSTPVEHDAFMVPVQGNTHLGNLINALLMAESGISVSESLDFASPFYRVALSQMARLVSQNPGLYTSIIMENPGMIAMLERRVEMDKRFLDMVRRKDEVAFEQLFGKASAHFGAPVMKEANELFMRLLSVMNTLYGQNSVTLEFNSAHDRPGLLEEISGVFGKYQVNLTGINSVTLGNDRIQFTMSFKQARSSNNVRLALQEIENWKQTRVEVAA